MQVVLLTFLKKKNSHCISTAHNTGNYCPWLGETSLMRSWAKIPRRFDGRLETPLKSPNF